MGQSRFSCCAATKEERRITRSSRRMWDVMRMQFEVLRGLSGDGQGDRGAWELPHPLAKDTRRMGHPRQLAPASCSGRWGTLRLRSGQALPYTISFRLGGGSMAPLEPLVLYPALVEEAESPSLCGSRWCRGRH